MSAAVAVDPALDQEYVAVVSRLGEAFLKLESAQAEVAQLKAARADVLKRHQADQAAKAAAAVKETPSNPVTAEVASGS